MRGKLEATAKNLKMHLKNFYYKSVKLLPILLLVIGRTVDNNLSETSCKMPKGRSMRNNLFENCENKEERKTETLRL